MDQIDATLFYATGTDYVMKRESRDLLSGRQEGQPPKKKLKSLDHNKTKPQIVMLSEQLLEGASKWKGGSESILSQPNNGGIPTISQIKLSGRRVQDKKNIQAQLDAVAEKVSKMTREKITLESVKEEAAKSVPTNDSLLRLGDERLEIRTRIDEMSRVQYWKNLGKHLPINKLLYTALYAFPRLRRMVNVDIPVDWKEDDNRKVTKKIVMGIISEYLRKAKGTVNRISEFSYGVNGKDGYVLPRDRHLLRSDLLMLLRFVVPVDVEETSNSAPDDKTRAIISSFTILDEHYTYTQDRNVNDDDDDDDEEEEDNCEKDTDKEEDEEDTNNENEQEDIDYANEEG